MSDAIYRITVGRLLCSTVREYLGRQQFVNPRIRYREGSGWFEREFIIVAPADELRPIVAAMQQWKRDVNAAAAKDQW